MSTVTMSTMPTQFDAGASGPANRVGLMAEDRPDVDPVTGKSVNPNSRRGYRRKPWARAYHEQGKLTVRQYNTALALYAAAAGLPAQDPLSAISIDKPSAPSDPQAAKVDARRAFSAMWTAVPAHCRPVVERVIMDDLPIWSGIGASAHDRHMIRLAVGLDAVADVTERRG